MLKIKSNHINIIIRLIFIVALILFTIFWSLRSMQLADIEKNNQKKLADAVEFCSTLFDDENKVAEKVGLEEIKDCDERLVTVGNEEEKVSELREYVDSAKKYFEWDDNAKKFFDEKGVVVENITNKDLDALKKEISELDKKYQTDANKKYAALEENYDAMKDAKNAVKELFKKDDLKDVKDNVKRKDYENAKKKVDNLKQEKLKNDLDESLKKVLEYVEKQEKIAKEKAEAARKAAAERKKKIANSWHRLKISPYYIDQVSEKYLNGCEAASLLMAMKYKGYIRGTSFKTFADDMPRSDDPNQGFFSDMKSLEPKDVGAHWIAPAPLAAYGRSYGGNVVNVSGWSIDKFDEEVKKGNPVVIYLTWSFNEPKKKVNGVPTNLHVMVLSGYNSYTGEQEFFDPWPSKGKNPSLSKARTEKLYKASGMRAVVVR